MSPIITLTFQFLVATAFASYLCYLLGVSLLSGIRSSRLFIAGGDVLRRKTPWWFWLTAMLQLIILITVVLTWYVGVLVPLVTNVHALSRHA